MRRRDQRGIALPSPVVLLSIVAVAMAVVAFIVTSGHGDDEKEITPAASTHSSAPASPTTSAPATPHKPKAKPKPKVVRSKVYVEVFNNTNIRGLAGQVAGKASTIGWNVVGADNWMGTVPATTVYYPPKLKAAGKKLALDLGIKRTHVAESDSMKGDRLTIVLTGPLS
ncbi:LytR C-terminal domain-containing protein [Nocardioides sp. DS6]|uniref:LytR C-terminal domain-containing protein n=1 Tax=Nocardioides eburneus TaxID=3231482 RepID=A0ABV3SUD9_9ACTN